MGAVPNAPIHDHKAAPPVTTVQRSPCRVSRSPPRRAADRPRRGTFTGGGHCEAARPAAARSRCGRADVVHQAGAGSWATGGTGTLGAGAGLTLALVIMAGLRVENDLADNPRVVRGLAMSFFIAGILSLAFMGFAGLFHGS